MTTRPDWLLFDLNGTLLDPGDALPALEDAITLAMALTVTGDYRDFAELLAGGLERRGLDAPEPTLFDDVGDGLARLADAGFRLAVVTNSSADDAEEKLGTAGIAGCFEFVAGSDEVGAFKPDERVYRHALGQTGHDAGDACLVAAHEFDLIGAAHVGMQTAYLARTGASPALVAPDYVASSLADLFV